MTNKESYFEEIKNLCLDKCKSYSFDEIAKDMFSKKEVIDTFLEQETQDPTFGFIIELLKDVGIKNGNIYIPGAGTGGLGRQIIKHFPDMNIIQIDKSPEMTKINQSHSEGYKNLKISEGDILETTFDNGTFDLIIAQGLIRYIPEDNRNDLLGQRGDLIGTHGKIIVCEGIAKDIIDTVKNDKLENTDTISQKAALFRFSLFYLLYKEYQNNKTFYKAVEEAKKENDKSYAQILREIAGRNDNVIYAKIFSKKQISN